MTKPHKTHITATATTGQTALVTPIVPLPLIRSVSSEEDGDCEDETHHQHHRNGHLLDVEEEGENNKDQQRPSSATATARRSANGTKRKSVRVRFSPEVVEKTEDAGRKKRRRCLLAMKKTSSNVVVDVDESSSSWYTPIELRTIQTSLIRAVQAYDHNSKNSTTVDTDIENDEEEDVDVLEYYTKPKRYHRRLKRRRMLETCVAVQDFACTIQTKVPLTDLLSELLHRYSSS